MRSNFKTYFLLPAAVGFVLILSSVFAFAQAEEERFIYDSQGRRDPFIPLVEKSGIRTDFAPPEEVINLPLKLEIKGILWSGKEYFAIINDQVLKKGEALDGVKIEKIEKNKVVVKYRTKEFTILFKKEKEK